MSAEILQIFKPLLVELETYDEDLDQEEFVQSGLALLEKLDINSRNTVVNFGKKIPRSHFEVENRFHPQISKRSQLIVEGSQLSHLPAEVRF